MRTIKIESFERWRDVARELVTIGTNPASVNLVDDDGQLSLFSDSIASVTAGDSSVEHKVFGVPRRFIELAGTVACHRDSQHWNLLYRALWRVTHGEPHLLQLSTDDLVHRLLVMEKQVRRDSHKMKAFVRFREVKVDVDQQTDGHFIAWYHPDHKILQRVAPFFARRFSGMLWTILTPDQSVHWDRQELTFGPGVSRGEAPAFDELEELWKTYYGSTFNPARVKIKMMKSEMPVRFWDTLPETEIIDQLLDDAPERVRAIIARQEGYQKTASQYLPQSSESVDQPVGQTLEQLKELARACTACDLYKNATQTVFGDGPHDAKLVLLGEQPGDQEDLTGLPFVGPAGEVLNQAFEAAGIQRKNLYLTNAVKHFKHTVVESDSKSRQPRRLHAKPHAREIRCCRPWFDAEWSLLSEAKVLVCLGVTAASVAFGPQFSLTPNRGKWMTSAYCPKTIATWHPSAILRTRDEQARIEKFQQLVADLQTAGAAASI